MPSSFGSAPGLDPGGLPRNLSVVPARGPERRRPRIAWLLVAVPLALLFAFVHHRTAKSESDLVGKGLVSVPTVAAALGEVHLTIPVTGTVAALDRTSLLAPRVVGSRSGINRGGDTNFGGGPGGGSDFNLVLLTLAKAGTHVHSGDVVAQFDPQNQLQRLDDYKDTVVQLENSVKGMMASLAAVKESHAQAVRSAKAEWDKAVLDLQTGPVHSDIDVEKYKLAVEEQQATYKELVSEAGLVEESQRAQIRVSELNRDQAKIELQRAQNNVERMTVRAPMNGIVVMESIVRNGEYGQIREGDQVFAGQPFVSIVDPTSMVLDATINQVDVEKLRLGMKALVRLDAYPALSFPGSVTGIGALARTGMSRATYVAEIPVRIKIDGLDPRLIPDLTGSAEIDTGSESNLVVLPRQAVFAESGEPVVYVKRAEGWSRAPVTLGIESATTVAVRTGLRPGDVVALQAPQ